jgi:hypothetical protein
MECLVGWRWGSIPCRSIPEVMDMVDPKEAIAQLPREALEANCLALANALFGVLETSAANAKGLAQGLEYCLALAKAGRAADFEKTLRELVEDAKKVEQDAKTAKAEILIQAMELTGASSAIGKVGPG